VDERSGYLKGDRRFEVVIPSRSEAENVLSAGREFAHGLNDEFSRVSRQSGCYAKWGLLIQETDHSEPRCELPFARTLSASNEASDQQIVSEPQ